MSLLLKGHAPFSHRGQWLYTTHPSQTKSGVCPICATFRALYFDGQDTSNLWPFHEHDPLDEDVIRPNVHPNCVCTLHRIPGSVRTKR